MQIAATLPDQASMDEKLEAMLQKLEAQRKTAWFLRGTVLVRIYELMCWPMLARARPCQGLLWNRRSASHSCAANGVITMDAVF